MNAFIDIAQASLNKKGEELCGDRVEYINDENGLIAVLSDGLGSGVKANILATLTAKIALTMIREGADITDTIETIVDTLPECSVRRLAYSTFTIIKIDGDLNMYMAEYDNPPVFLYRNGHPMALKKEKRLIKEKCIYETQLQLQVGDMLTVVSDGAVHAGVGAFLNLGWQWDDICKYLAQLNKMEKTSRSVASSLSDICNNLYDGKPGDDTTVLTIKVREPEKVDMFTGPPVNADKDQWIIDQLNSAEGKKVICGGTTANIASRILGRGIQVDLSTMTKEVPPYGHLKGFDLITEGVLTLQKTLEKLKRYSQNSADDSIFKEKDAASVLGKLLIDDCTHLTIWFGRAVNPAHQNTDFPIDFNIKLRIVGEMVNELKRLGKSVTITFI